MGNKFFHNILVLVIALLLIIVFQVNGANKLNNISLSCKADNDLYLVLKENKITCDRYNSPEEAIKTAREGSGVLVLADGYPASVTLMDASLYEKAVSKKLRLYVEYPSYLPGVVVGSPRGTQWERAVIASDGSQAVRWWNRNDCNGEVAGTMGLAGAELQNSKYLQTAGNIGDWLYFKSMMSLGDLIKPDHPAYGLFGWNDSPKYAGPGFGDGYAVYYGDDNARSMLGMMIAAKAQKTDRYDKRLLMCLLGNLRMSGVYGFQPDRIDQGPLEKTGWEHLFRDKTSSYSPHYQANLWACYLWAYQQTGFELFLKRAKTGIGMTMAAYPDKWKWTNGIQQERAKMLLPLAWLIRLDDTEEHRSWLRKIAGDLIAGQAECGAIREQIGEAGKGGFPPPATNEAYGTSEAPLIQTNSDGVSDLLYTSDFAFLGLHEAAAATNEEIYRDAEDKLAKFLCRIQIRSERHPELDGGWFRAFDFNRWEYWASNADAGWGAWSIETGWTQSWITAILALRQIKTSVWDYIKESKIERNFDALRKLMIPDEVIKNTNENKIL